MDPKLSLDIKSRILDEALEKTANRAIDRLAVGIRGVYDSAKRDYDLAEAVGRITSEVRQRNHDAGNFNVARSKRWNFLDRENNPFRQLMAAHKAKNKVVTLDDKVEFPDPMNARGMLNDYYDNGITEALKSMPQDDNVLKYRNSLLHNKDQKQQLIENLIAQNRMGDEAVFKIPRADDLVGTSNQLTMKLPYDTRFDSLVLSTKNSKLISNESIDELIDKSRKKSDGSYEGWVGLQKHMGDAISRMGNRDGMRLEEVNTPAKLNAFLASPIVNREALLDPKYSSLIEDFRTEIEATVASNNISIPEAFKRTMGKWQKNPDTSQIGKAIKFRRKKPKEMQSDLEMMSSTGTKALEEGADLTANALGYATSGALLGGLPYLYSKSQEESDTSHINKNMLNYTKKTY